MNILVFDLEVTGHHPGYIRHLLRYWPSVDAALTMVVSPEFMQQHNDVVQTKTRAKVTWCPISDQELAWYEASKRSLLRYAWAEWRLFCRYAKKVKAEQGLVMYIDRFQLPLAMQLPLPCKLSGIYFRPKFHYAELPNHQPAKGEQVRGKREKWLWRRALRHSKVKTLFCLDPLAVEPLRVIGEGNKVVQLPDPVEIYPQPAEAAAALRQELGFDAHRKVFLLFGVLDKRKGIYQVLEALKQFPAQEQSQMALWLVGPLSDVNRTNVLAEIETLQHESSVQIVIRDQFVADEEVQPLFDVADVILALYQKHVGMSAILVRAAAAGKPVLASDYGLMGALAEQYKLGITIDANDIECIGSALIDIASTEFLSQYDPAFAMQLAVQNSAKRYTECIAMGVSS